MNLIDRPAMTHPITPETRSEESPLWRPVEVPASRPALNLEEIVTAAPEDVAAAELFREQLGRRSRARLVPTHAWRTGGINE
jgi:hypothetical protein